MNENIQICVHNITEKTKTTTSTYMQTNSIQKLNKRPGDALRQLKLNNACSGIAALPRK